MSRIVVTGSQGLIGCSLVPYLESCGHEVIKAGRQEGCEIHADLSNINQVCNALDSHTPEIIINLAALANVDMCEKNPHQAYLSNVLIVENLTSWIRKHGSKCYLIQISTDQVYDGIGPHVEDDVTITNYYGLSKYAGELAAALTPSTVLRTNFFGRSQCQNRKSLSDWLVESLRVENEVKVFDDILISSISFHTFFKTISVVIQKRIPGVFNIGSKCGMTKADFAFILAELLGLPTRSMKRSVSDNANFIAYRPKDMTMNSEKFEKLYNIEFPRMKEEIHSIQADYINETR